MREELIVLFFSALFISLAATPLFRRLALKLGVVDHPGSRKIHTRAIPRLGGAAIVMAMFLPLALVHAYDPIFVAFLTGAAVIAFTGLVDDIFSISPRLKLAGEVLAAFLFVGMSGVRLTTFGDLVGLGEIRTGAFALPVTVFCIVGVVNALNLSDGLDGLAGGISLVACYFLSVLAYMTGNTFVLPVGIVLIGALFGFLRYNTHPANLFMGDTGSLLLGFSLAVMSIMLVQHGLAATQITPVTVAGVMGLPVIDTLLVMLRRIWHGGSPLRPDKSHLHHRLLDLGASHGAVVGTLYLAATFFGFAAWELRGLPEWVQFVGSTGLGAILYGTVFVFQHNRLRLHLPNFMQMRFTNSDRLHEAGIALMSQSGDMVTWLLVVGLVLPVVLIGAVSSGMMRLALYSGLFLIVLFPWKSSKPHGVFSYGMIYIASVCLFAVYRFNPGSPWWLPYYGVTLNLLLLGWVLLKVKYLGHKTILQFTPFEVLAMGSMLIVPLVLVPSLGFDGSTKSEMLLISFQAIPIVLATKVLMQREPQRKFAVALALMAAFALIGIRGYVEATELHDKPTVNVRHAEPVPGMVAQPVPSKGH